MTCNFAVVISTRIETDIHKNLLQQCIESVERFVGIGESSKLIIVDSSSTNKSYMYESNITSNVNIHVEDISNTQYEGGAFYYAYKKYDADRYLFLQDSSHLTNNIDFMTSQRIGIFNPMDTWIHCDGRHKQIVYDWFQNTSLGDIPDRFTMVQSAMFYAHNSVLKDLERHGFYNNLPYGSPNGKITAEAYERYLGAALTVLGYETEMLQNLLPISKIFMNRQ